MGQLVPNNRADVAVVFSVGSLRIVQRRLQNRGGKIDVVHRGVVIGIHGRGSRDPFRRDPQACRSSPTPACSQIPLRATHCPTRRREPLRASSNRATDRDSRSYLATMCSLTFALCLVSALIQSWLSISLVHRGLDVVHHLQRDTPCSPQEIAKPRRPGRAPRPAHPRLPMCSASSAAAARAGRSARGRQSRSPLHPSPSASVTGDRRDELPAQVGLDGLKVGGVKHGLHPFKEIGIRDVQIRDTRHAGICNKFGQSIAGASSVNLATVIM